MIALGVAFVLGAGAATVLLALLGARAAAYLSERERDRVFAAGYAAGRRDRELIDAIRSAA